MTPVRLKPAAPRSRVKHSTTEPLCSKCEINLTGDASNTVLSPVHMHVQLLKFRAKFSDGLTDSSKI